MDTLVKFKIFDEEGVICVEGDDGDQVKISYDEVRCVFKVEENGKLIANVSEHFKAPRDLNEHRKPIYQPFTPPKL